jgi:hypothetical protein
VWQSTFAVAAFQMLRSGVPQSAPNSIAVC